MPKIDNYKSEFKSILASKRANIFYLEHCRVMVKGGRVLYLTDHPEEQEKQYWNIPIANTTVILLGVGTSITQAAVRMLASAGVMLGFSGSGGTPLIAAMECPRYPQEDDSPDPDSQTLADTDILFFSPQSEYRPTEYLQGWMAFWCDDLKRLAAAKKLQFARIDFLERVWNTDRDLKSYGFDLCDYEVESALKNIKKKISTAPKVSDLLQAEAVFTKQLYRIAAQLTDYSEFNRERHSDDLANNFLDHGNYLAYGLAASTLWVLGIPHGFAVMHGKTRRGALVFDVADLIKDTLVLPWAFICAKQNMSEHEFRQQCLQAFTRHKAMDFMFEQVKKISVDPHL